MSRREVGRWPDDVVVKLTPGDDARLAIEGEHPDLTLEFRRADGTALPALAPTDVSAERTLWALPAAEVASLAGVTGAAFRDGETTLMAGQVWWGDRWQGWGAGTNGAVRLVVGPRGKPGHTPVFTWDGTVLEIDGEPGPDLRGPVGPPGDWSLRLDPDTPGVGILVGPALAFAGDSTYADIPIGA